MEVIDPGHMYGLWFFDNDGSEPSTGVLQFVKRNDPPEKYPGNTNAYPGTQIQEVLRALIDRAEYVNNQVPCEQTHEVIVHLINALWLLEQRHADRHDARDEFRIVDISTVHTIPFCNKCGHIMCFCNPSEPEFYYE